MADPRKFSFGSFRGWHIWLSIALSLPILIVGLTAIFIAHDKSLDLKSITIPAAWSPGTLASGGPGKLDTELRAVATDSQGRVLLGGKAGLFRDSGEAAPVAIEGPLEVRAMAASGERLLVAAKNGLWLLEGSAEKASRLSKAEHWSVAVASSATASGDMLVAVPKGEPVRISRDAGRSWTPWAQAGEADSRFATTLVDRAQAGNQTITVSKFVMDLHTGKAFFGKEYEWIWIDLIGATMSLLTITGLVMWWRGQRRKVQQLQAALAEAQSRAAAPGLPAAA